MWWPVEKGRVWRVLRLQKKNIHIHLSALKLSIWISRNWKLRSIYPSWRWVHFKSLCMKTWAMNMWLDNGETNDSFGHDFKSGEVKNGCYAGPYIYGIEWIRVEWRTTLQLCASNKLYFRVTQWNDNSKWPCCPHVQILLHFRLIWHAKSIKGILVQCLNSSLFLNLMATIYIFFLQEWGTLISWFHLFYSQHLSLFRYGHHFDFI